MESSPASNIENLRNGALGFTPAMQSAGYSNTSGSDIVNVLYFNADKLGLLGRWGINGQVRDIDVYRLYHLAATQPGDTVDVYCFVAHFKASQGSANELDRFAAAQNILAWLQSRPGLKRFVLCGDLNLYSSNEPAFQSLYDQFEDPAGQPVGWQGPAYAALHTQSPATNAVPCAVTGGMDNRFDFILVSQAIAFGATTISLVPDTYEAVGNDGTSYDIALNCIGNASVPPDVCTALRNTSDHLPVSLQLLVAPPAGSATQEIGKPAAWQICGNPVRDGQLRLRRADFLSLDVSYTIVDSYGRRVMSGQTYGHTISVSVSALPDGLYRILLDGTNHGAIPWVKME